MTCRQISENAWVCGSGKLKPTEKTAWRWCHKCRFHSVHDLFLLIADWYDPEPVWYCPNCNEDHTGWNI